MLNFVLSPDIVFNFCISFNLSNSIKKTPSKSWIVVIWFWMVFFYQKILTLVIDCKIISKAECLFDRMKVTDCLNDASLNFIQQYSLLNKLKIFLKIIEPLMTATYTIPSHIPTSTIDKILQTILSILIPDCTAPIDCSGTNLKTDCWRLYGLVSQLKCIAKSSK